MKIVVIIPTYNEKNTIVQLIGAVEGEFEKIPNHNMGILVVDGNSPDGTAEAVAQKKRIYQNIDLIVEKEKRGLGMAYITGMNYAIKNLKADAIIEFDGDGQHDPADIKQLVVEFDRGYDYVIGSRYVPGGGIPEEWALYRKLLSKYGSLFIKFVLSLPTNDNTSGLKLSRVKNFAERLSLAEDKILSKRYAYKIQLLYEMVKMSAKVKEIPIKFLERGGGDSKSSIKDILDSLGVVFTLYFRHSER